MFRAAVVLCLTALVAGCGSGSTDLPIPGASGDVKATTKAPVRPADVRVGEVGYISALSYAYLENKEDREVSVKLTFTAKDPAGADLQLLDADSREVLPPSSITPIALFIATKGAQPPGQERTLSARIEVIADIATPAGGRLEGSTIKADTPAFTHRGFTGTVTNGYSKAISSGVVVAMCTDKAGKVVGAHSTQFSAAAGGSESVEFAESDRGLVASCQLYPRVSDNTEFE